MGLFNDSVLIIDRDGLVIYQPNFLEATEVISLQSKLIESTPWESETYSFYGKTLTTKRKSALYGDNGVLYKYSGVTKKGVFWTKELYEIKQQVEHLTSETFNSCLLNLYPTGQEGMGWHKDNEPELGANPTVVSISLGAERNFKIKHDSKKLERSILLESGSALIMKNEFQHFWKHSLPKTKKQISTRLNLTFRNIKSQ